MAAVKRDPNSLYWRPVYLAERRNVIYYLEQAEGDVNAAAQLLKVDRSFLYRRMRYLDIERPPRRRSVKAKDSVFKPPPDDHTIKDQDAPLNI